MVKQYLETGKIVAIQGLRGEVRVQPWSDSPAFLLDFDCFYSADGQRNYPVESIRAQKNMVILKLAGVDTPEQAALLRGTVLYINRADVPLEEGEFFVQDLIGLQVCDADTDTLYGTLTQVSQTGANDVYHIRFEGGKERLVPAIPQVIVKTEPENGIMLIRPLKGLFDDED